MCSPGRSRGRCSTTWSRGLLSDLEKKNGWTLAQRAGHTHPGRMQTFLSRGAWRAEDLETEVRAYVVGHLGAPDGVLIVDDTQMIKKGDKSVGVAPQHCGATNQIENCQVVVMLTYAGPAGHAFIGHRLYLPKRWTDDAGRCREARIPATVGFATKLDQAIELLTEAVDAGVPFGWVTMDGGYGQYPQVSDETPAGGFAHTLLIRRSISDPTDVTFFLAHAPDPTPATTLIIVAVTRWRSRRTTNRERSSSASISTRSAPGPPGITWSPCACPPTRSSPCSTPD
ncbi:IS701 family transposase [Actinoplanes sp. ATCC 53533]|uniref:IS701 family transposase n=1 Tax=Actinoplanes sp. ATCC 53533 TaxID=1288362 RepID=UPI003512F6CB